jgi:hypothetical protein
MSSIAPLASSLPAGPLAPARGAAALADACRALWLATLGLMTAYMHTPAPAHRWLLARRIAGNLDTLSQQDCFAGDCRRKFGRLSRRWQRRAVEFAPDRASPRSGERSRWLPI